MRRVSTKNLAGLGIASILSAIAFAGCNKQPQTATGTSDHQHAEGDGHDHDHASATNDGSKGGVTARATRLEFKTQPKQITAGVPAIWTLKIWDTKTKKPVRNFDTVHEKMMHLIVVSKDLSWFNHIHPEYKDHGLFITRTSVPRPGTYKLYADYTPAEGVQQVAPHEFSTSDIPKVSFLQMVPPHYADKSGKDGWIIKKVPAMPEGEPHEEGAQARSGGPSYQVALMPMPAKLVAGKAATLHFQVRDAQGKSLSDLEPYLGAMGHAVILSRDTSTYLHTHPMAGGAEHGEHQAAATGGPDVMFHTNFPATGIYKVWGQFKHKGLIITAPFVLRVEAGAKAGEKTKPATTKQAAYYCPMHPQVTSNDPKATCSKCGGMKLVKRA